MIADTVPGTKILVGGVVEHTPAEAAHVLAVCIGRVQHPGVAQRMLLPVGPIVKGLCGVHMAIALRDQQWLVPFAHNVLFPLYAGVVSRMGKVVKGVHILQKTALFQIPDAGGGPAGIQSVGNGICSGIEGVVILAFVDAYPPQDNTGMIPVLQNHLLQHMACQVLPGCVTDVLPAGQLREDQKPHFITGIQKMLALGIVAGAHGIAAQLLLQDAGILPLQALRGGIADIRVALMPVQTPQKGLFPVQIEAVRPENRRAEAETGLAHVQRLPLFIQQLRHAGIEHRCFRCPGCRIRQGNACVDLRRLGKEFGFHGLPSRILQRQAQLSIFPGPVQL